MTRIRRAPALAAAPQADPVGGVIVAGPYSSYSNCTQIMRQSFPNTDYRCVDGSVWGESGWYILNPN